MTRWTRLGFVLRAGAFAVLGLAIGSQAVSADNQNNHETVPNPAEWGTYDTDGSGRLSPAECGALSSSQATTLRDWINNPADTGIFGSYHDDEARNWVNTHFEDRKAAACKPVLWQIPGDNSGVSGAVDTIGDLPNDIRGAPGSLVSGAFDKAVDRFESAADNVMMEAVTIWTRVPSDAATNTSAIEWVEDHVRGVTAVICVLGVIIAGIRVAMAQRGDAIVDIVKGFGRVVIVGALTTSALPLMLNAGDSFSRWILDASVEGSISGESGLFAAAALETGLAFPLALIAILTTLIQIGILLLQGAFAVIIGGLLQVSAAATVVGETSTWRKHLGWLIALLLAKPAAAVCYAAAFRLLHGGSGSTAGDVVSAIQGILIILAAVLALPALMRVVSPLATASGASAAGVIGGAAALATGARMLSTGNGANGVIGQSGVGGGGMPGPSGSVGVGGGSGSAGAGLPGPSGSGGSFGGRSASPAPPPPPGAGPAGATPTPQGSPGSSSSRPGGSVAPAASGPSGAAGSGMGSGVGAAAGAAASGPVGAAVAATGAVASGVEKAVNKAAGDDAGPTGAR